MGVADVKPALDGLPISVSEACGYRRAIPALGHTGSPAGRFESGGACAHTGPAVCALGRTDEPCGRRPFATLEKKALGLTTAFVVVAGGLILGQAVVAACSVGGRRPERRRRAKHTVSGRLEGSAAKVVAFA